MSLVWVFQICSTGYKQPKIRDVPIFLFILMYLRVSICRINSLLYHATRPKYTAWLILWVFLSFPFWWTVVPNYMPTEEKQFQFIVFFFFFCLNISLTNRWQCSRGSSASARYGETKTSAKSAVQPFKAYYRHYQLGLHKKENKLILQPCKPSLSR